MYRTLFAWGILGLIAVTSGCAMCDHPYDYCGPLFTGGCDGECCVGPRAGSIRAMGGPDVPYYEEAPPAEVMPYYDQAGRPVTAPQAQARVQSRPAVRNGQMPWNRNASASRQSTADARQLIPASDRPNAKVLSVTDQTLEELQARKASGTTVR